MSNPFANWTHAQVADFNAKSASGRKPKLDVAPTATPAEAKAEKELHRQIVTWLEQHKGIAVGHARMDKPSTFPKGWPDVVFAYEGRAFALEIKTNSGRLTQEQEEYRDRMTANGWAWRLVRSLAEVRDLLRKQ